MGLKARYLCRLLAIGTTLVNLPDLIVSTITTVPTQDTDVHISDMDQNFSSLTSYYHNTTNPSQLQPSIPELLDTQTQPCPQPNPS